MHVDYIFRLSFGFLFLHDFGFCRSCPKRIAQIRIARGGSDLIRIFYFGSLRPRTRHRRCKRWGNRDDRLLLGRRDFRLRKWQWSRRGHLSFNHCTRLSCRWRCRRLRRYGRLNRHRLLPVGFCQQSLDHVDQRVGRNKRFFQNTISAHPLRFLLVEWIKSANQQHDRGVHIARIVLDELAKFVAVAHRHEDIGED